jgi:hypothetical protein
MFRIFTLPMTASYQSIWQLMVTAGFIDSLGNMLVSGVKNDAIIPDRVMELDVRPADANTVNTTYRDSQADPGVEQVLDNMSKRSNRNSICLKDYTFANASSQSLVVEIESA